MKQYKQLERYHKGQRVILRINGKLSAKKGATGTVVGRINSILFGKDYWADIKWDRNKLSGTQGDGGYHDSNFDLLEDLVPEGIDAIAGEEDGK